MIFLYWACFPFFMLMQNKEAVDLRSLLFIFIYIPNLPNLPRGFIYLLFGAHLNSTIDKLISFIVQVLFFGGVIYYVIKCRSMKFRYLKLAFGALLLFYVLSLKGCAMMWASTGYGF